MSESVPTDVDSAQPQLPDAEPPKGALATIFLVVLIDLMGFGIIIPLLPFYVTDMQHNSILVAVLFSIFSVFQFIGSPILGALSDRIGRRPVLAFSQFGSALGYLLLGLATVASFHFSPVVMMGIVYASRIIDGFTGGNISTAQAYISDVTTPKNRARGMGLIGAAFGIGFTFGPFLGGMLGHFNQSWPGYAAALMSLTAGILTLRKLPESRTHKPTEAEAWLHPAKFRPILRNRVLMELMVISFCLMAAFVMMESTIGLFLNRVFGWERLGTGLYFGYAGIIIAVVQGGLIRRLTRIWGDWPLAITGPLLVAVGMCVYMLIGYTHGFAICVVLLMIAGAVNATGRSLQGPTISSLISKVSDQNQQGVVFGFYSGLSSLARIVGPIIAGLAYPYLRNTGQFLTASIIALAMGFWLMGLRRSTPGDETQAPVVEHEMQGM
ncbi:MAG TPA: MFS transporter [Tepidisphaeraceae bacterium]|jgi:DHA1 family tetracycline resistance protein-like MFS transporter|nr:MFS transporter [Tepidisphaeraceae bacterium]